MKSYILISFLILSLFSCKKSSESTGGSPDISEPAQQVGDVMASIDEAGAGNSSIAYQPNAEMKTFARYEKEPLRDFLFRSFAPSAVAASCATGSSFSSCSSNVITRTFNDCTTLLGTVTVSGTVTLTWVDGATDNTCAMTTSGHSISRSPNFTMTGRRGATLTVSKAATYGQRITRGATANALTFTNDGIRRQFNGSLASFDFTTQTTGSGLTITGATRAGRVLSSSGGAALRVTNNNSGAICDFTPTNVTWAATCNCPTSGSWSVSCQDGSSASLSLTGCGTGTYTVGASSESVSFDRCYGL